MEQWEYEFVQVTYKEPHYPPPLGWVIAAIGEDGQPSDEVVELRPKMAELGQQGWELTGVVAAGSSNVSLLAFKRRKP